MRREATILLAGSNLWQFGEGLMGPLFAVFTERIGGSVLDISWAWAIYLIVTGVCTILIGRFADGKLNRKEHVMVAGYALNTLCTFGYLFVTSPAHLFIVQAGLGVALALSNPTWYALYAHYEDRRHDTVSWGLASGEGKMLMGVAIIVGGFIVSRISFAVLFMLMGSVQLLATIVQARVLFLRKT